MKYIIDIPDDTSYLNIVKLSEGCVAKVKTVYIPDLTPYTEPDRKAIEDEVWEFVRNCIIMMDGSDFVEAFDSCSYINLLEYTYQEAKAKYEKWMADKKQKETLELEEVTALANRIGIHRLYSLVKEIRGE